MYAIMCQTYKDNIMTSEHPADLVNNIEELKDWMHNKHKIMIPHMNGMEGEVWHFGKCTDVSMQLFNEDESIERRYYAKDVGE